MLTKTDEFMGKGRPVVEIEDLAIAFDGRGVLENFSLTVGDGAKIVIEGRSGSGKSSILKSILGFVRPSAGRIAIDSRSLDGRSVWHIRRRLGYVAQEPQMGQGTTRQLIERSFSYRANSGLQFSQDRLLRLCERFCFDGSLLDKDAAGLSGGEKQRAAVIGALLLERPIYLFDEPTSAMDAHSRNVFAGIIKQADFTAIIVSHEQSLKAVADTVVPMPEREI